MNPDLEQYPYHQRTIVIYEIEHDSIRLTKSMAYFDRFHEDIKYFDLIWSVSSALIEIPKQKILHRIRK